jgi:amino acid adenylation domain-containing protein
VRGAAPRPPGSRIPQRHVQGGPLPLSLGQEQVWFFSQLSPELGVYNEGATVKKRGPLDIDALRRAFNEFVRRHEIWRTCFPVLEGRPVQVVLPPPRYELPLTDVSGLPPAEREAKAIRLATDDARAPYDLSCGPLVRPRLVRLAEDDHRLYLSLHHIVFDGVSLYRIMLPELVALYDAYAAGRPSPLPEPELQFGDFAVWQRGVAAEDFTRPLDYWRSQLAGELPAGQLPLDRERPAVQGFRGAVEHLELSSELVRSLKDLARRQGVSLFMVLSAAFTTLLHRYSGSDDVIFGTPVDVRNRPELQSMMGFCLNAAVLRTDVSGDPTFVQLLSRVREITLSALANDVPFERLVRELQPERDLSGNPIFQLMFGIEPPAPKVDPRWSVHQMDVGVGAAKFDLYLEQDERPEGHVSCRFVYNTDLFERLTVERLKRHWLRLLESIVADAERRLSELPMLEDKERSQVLVEWNSTATEFPALCTHELIALRAQETPEACAAECEGARITYGELETRANRLAQRLRALGVGPDVPAGICLRRSLEMLVAVLAIWKAGGAYLPLDPSYPSERLTYMLDDSEAPVLVTESGLVGLPKGRTQVVCLDKGEESCCTEPRSAPEGRVGGDDLAYLIYTSGSTGKPKGVEIPHRALLNFLCSMAQEPGFGQNDVLVAVTTLSFDIAGLELFLPLLSGGKVVIATAEVAADGRRLGELLADSGATFLQATPASWRLLLESGWTGSRNLTGLCGGEAWGTELAAQLLERCGRLYNVYGPTETTIWSTMARVIDSGRPPSIGRPLANTELYVLDRLLQPVPIGVPGELYIGGAGLARGYRKRPELTAERFIASPLGAGERLYRTGDLARFRSTGELEYLGRLDQQVKVRGFRIEPGEVEAVLIQQPHIARAAVMAWEDRPGDRRLVAYLVPDGDPPEAGELKTQLRGQLPEYMVPSALVFLDRFPLTPNGKLDRKALPRPEPEETGSQDREPQTPVQVALARIWAEVLGLQRMSLEADFFELGGHSLLGTRLATKVREAFGVELPLRAFFQARTLEAMAALIEQERNAYSIGPALARFFRGEATVESLAAQLDADVSLAGAPLLVNARASGSLPPLFFVFSDESALLSLRHFLPAFPLDQPIYGLVPERKGRRFDRRLGIEDLSRGLLPLIQKIQPAGPYHICGHSLGGLVAYDLGRQMGGAGESVAFLGVVDALTPVATARWMSSLMNPRARLRRQFRRGFREGVAKLWEVADRQSLVTAVRVAGRRPRPAQEEFDVDGAFHVAMRYRPRDYQGRIVVFWTDSSATASDGDDLGWAQSHEGPLERVHLAGDHLTLLQEPQVTAAAEAIAYCLREAQGAFAETGSRQPERTRPPLRRAAAGPRRAAAR